MRSTREIRFILEKQDDLLRLKSIEFSLYRYNLTKYKQIEHQWFSKYEQLLVITKKLRTIYAKQC